MTLKRRNIVTSAQRSVVCQASVFAKASPDEPPDKSPGRVICCPSSLVCRPSSVVRRLSAFTVLELLVVISIIAILLGVILPSFLQVRDKAKYTKARVTAKNLETAFKSYLDYYRTWPSDFGSADTTVEIEGNIFKIMRGETVGGDNSGSVVFYEFETTNEATGALDPWSDPDPLQSSTWQRYWVRTDSDFDNKITVGGSDVYRSVVVWSYGADRTNDTEDDVKSWE